MKLDNDNLVGHWVYNRPYVWIENKDFKKCKRLYLLHDEDEVFLYTRKGMELPKRKTQFKNFNWLYGSHKVSLLDLWKSEKKQTNCMWVKNYFDAYVEKKDGELQYLDVRKNGKKIKCPNDKIECLLKAKILPKTSYFMKSSYTHSS